MLPSPLTLGMLALTIGTLMLHQVDSRMEKSSDPCAPSEQVMLVKGAVLPAAVAFDLWTKRRSGAASR
jgi:hypothetical protein